MNLFRTSALTAISTLIKVAVNFLINKMLAVIGGPAALAILGQFQNFVLTATSIGNGSVATGVVKYVSEGSIEGRKYTYIKASLVITLSSSFFISVLMVVFPKELSEIIFSSDTYSNIFYLFSFFIFFYTLNTIVLAAVNGLREIKVLTTINIFGSLIGLLFATALIRIFNEIGALYALLLNQLFIFACAIILLAKNKIVDFRVLLKEKAQKQVYLNLGKYSALSFGTVVLSQVGQILVRTELSASYSWDVAGYWQGIVHMSTMYLMFVTSCLGVYYIPKIASLTSVDRIRAELFKGAYLFLPIVFFGLIIIYMLRKYLVLLVFSSDFYPIVEIIHLQLIADFIKVFAMLMSYILVAKGFLKVSFFCELIYYTTFVILSIYLIGDYSVKGVLYSNLVGYSLYTVVLFYFTFNRVLKKNNEN